MSIEDEKKLVATCVMGWKVKGSSMKGHESLMWIESPDCIGNSWNLSQWMPHIDRKWWDEIWEKMDDEMFKKYRNNLEAIFGITSYHPYSKTNVKLMHTAKPKLCWKALITTLIGKDSYKVTK